MQTQGMQHPIIYQTPEIRMQALNYFSVPNAPPRQPGATHGTLKCDEECENKPKD